MKFPELVTVAFTMRKVSEEEMDGGTWLTYALEGAPGIEAVFQIEAGSFDDQDRQDLEAALAGDLAEAIVATVREAQARLGGLN